MTRQEKMSEVEQLAVAFQGTRHAFLVGFQGMTVQADTALRNELRRAGVGYHVVKNTLARRAAKGTVLEQLGDKFRGPTAVALAPEDPVGAAKLLVKLFKDYQQFAFKAGVVDGSAIAEGDVEALANMPSREELLSRIMFLVNSGAQRIASVTSGVARNVAVVTAQVRDQKAE
ncbi:MAG: 50S ribosomal protein L10 [Chloracidobacterium sp.]|uniref:Large ribosomal subunit protein uL10 n=1 Tax=Chloracidobacterium validum TaxID=2821543 RepID=A0ABX8BBQ9_9BACT|nr:50S ribosomal protein L10 [Chloracidobacterium validum]QUW03205.1 50S ribosomal protein L10 [Chloracidobacterium validum]